MTDASRIQYASREPSDWNAQPHDVDTALDELAGRVSANETDIDGRLPYSDLKGTGIVACNALGGTNTITEREITAGAGIAVSNGDGVSGNPTVSALLSGAHFYASTDSSSFTTSEEVVPYDTEAYAASWISVSAGEFTFAESGTYMVTAVIGANQVATSTLASWYARPQEDVGSGYVEIEYARTGATTNNSLTDWQTATITFIRDFDDGDKFRIVGARAGGSATFEWRGGLGYCHCSVLRIG